MSFSKAPIQRFNDNKKENSDSPSPSRTGTSKTMIPGPSHRTSSSQVSQVSQRSQNSPSTTSIKKSTVQIHSESTETHKDTMKRISKTSLRERPVTPLSPRGKIPVSQSTVQRQAAGSKKPTSSSFIDMSPLSTPTHMKSPSKPVHNSDKTTKRILETRFHTKKKQFENMKKELCGKQKSLLDLYSGMLELKERAIDSTGTDLGPLEEIKLVDLSTMKAKLDNTNVQTSTQPRQAVGSGEDPAALNNLFVNKDLDNEFITKLEKKLQYIPQQYTVMLEQMLVKRDETSEWLKNIKNKVEEDDFQKQIEHHISEGDNLNKQLEEVRDLLDQTTGEMIQDIKSKLHVLKPLEKGEYDKKLLVVMSENAELQRKLKSLNGELDNEREKTSCLKDRKSTVDIQLKGARQRLRDLEQKLQSDEIKLAQMLSQMKVLENQLKAKESTFEHRAKELQKMNRSTGEQVSKLEKQRNILEARINELKKDLNTKESEALTVITDLQNKLNEAKQITDEAVRSRKQAETELEAAIRRVQEVEEKSRQVIDMAEKTKTIVVTGDESKHSEREIELWRELQSTRGLLKSAETQVQELKEEKAKFIETFKKADQENEEDVREICTKYGAEIIQKDEHIHILQLQVQELSDSIAKRQEQYASLEAKVQEYQELFNRAQHDDPAGITAQLQASEFLQKLLDMQTTLSGVLSQNEQLEQALIQKQLEVEQRDRVMQGQSKVLKVRDELIGLLNGKEQCQEENMLSLQLTQNDIEQITTTRAEEMLEVCSTLESKQMQVIGLEKLVKELKEQNERGQAQRTRYEARMAQLEQTLQEKRNQRGNKFLFL